MFVALLMAGMLVFFASALMAKPQDKGKPDKAEKTAVGKPEDAGKEAKEAKEGKDEKTEKAEAEEGEDKGKGEEKKAEAVAKKLEKEETKHNERIAKLERLLELMKEKDNPEAVANIQSSIEKENARHARVLDRLTKESAEGAGKFKEKMKKVEDEEKAKGGGKGKGKGREKGNDDADE